MVHKIWKIVICALIVCASFNLNVFVLHASESKIANISAKAKSAPGHGADNAVDGDVSTYWQSPDTTSMEDYMRYIDIDLHGYYNVAAIEIMNVEGAYYHYEIYASADGANYQKVAYKNDDTMADGDGERYTIGQVKARYLRVNMSFNSKEQAVNIADVNVYGTLINDEPFTKKAIEVESFEESKWGKEYTKVENDPVYAKEKTLQEMTALVGRVIGTSYQDDFVFEMRDAMNGRDVFELDDRNGKIVVRGNNGISLASGFNYYLKYYANVDYNPLFESNLKMPKKLPKVDGSIVKDTQYEYRYALNFCTYSYTMSFWNWDEYEAFIDWAAMNGVNLMLDIVGQEEVLRETLRQFNYTDEEIKEYLTGPGYFAWFYMQNMYGFGGPLPDNWFDQRAELGRQIHDRMQTYGITPVMQGFSGQVPVDFADKNTDSVTVNPGGWPGFQRPYMLKTALSDSDIAEGKQDYFDIVGDAFYEAQTKVFGNITKYYAVDPFHEGGNISGTGLDIVQIYNIVQKKMIENDEDAVWVMQQWQWGIDENKLSGLYKKDQAIVLDLQSDIRSQASPMENQGVPWIWNMLHNFGGRMGLDGEPQNVSQNITEAYNNNNYMKGIGITPEAINNSPMVYELLFDMTWTNDPINYREWVQGYAKRRYGGTNASIEEAWDILLDTAYAKKGDYYQGASESVINARPADTINSASSWGHSDIKYDKKELEKVVQLFANSYEALKDSPAFIYDFVDVTKQMLANAAQEYHPLMVQAYQDKDKEEFKKISQHFLDLIKMQDQVLGNSKEFLLGNWIEQSRSMLEGQDDWTKDVFELNARALITTWGPQKNANGGGLLDYSNRQWSGLTESYYLPRWEKWINDRVYALENNTSPVNNDWFMYGWEWANQKSDQGAAFPTKVRNDNLKELALEAFDKFSVTNMDAFIENANPETRVNLALSKPVDANVEGNDTKALTDGDTDRGWKAKDGVKEASLTVDLGNMNQVQVIAFSLQQIANTFPMRYTVDVYNGSEWVLEVGKSGEDGITSKNEIEYKGLLSKVRYNFSTIDGSDLPEIKELYVYGKAEVPKAYINLAKNATATGSVSKPAPETPSAVIDGNEKVGFVSANGAVPAWVKVELPQVQMVNKVVLKFEPGVYDRSYAFRFVAVDGDGNETLLLERTDADLSLQQQTKYEFDVNANIKYVRIDITKAKVPSNGGNAWPLIAEIELLQEQEKELKTENIALHKTVTSSTPAQAGSDPSKAVDGNTKSLWISDRGKMPTDLRVDLGKDSYVQNSRLVFETAGRAYRIKVTTENEAGVINTVLDLTETNDVLAKEYDVAIHESIRYVTVAFVGSSNPNATPWPAIAELEVYGVPKNIAPSALLTSNLEGVDLKTLQDNDVETSVSLTGAKEKELTYQFDRSYDINALEVYKASVGALKFVVSYANGNDDYKVLGDYTGNKTDLARTLYTFDNAVFADRIRLQFINEEIALQEIKIYEANVTERLQTYITQIEKQLAMVEIGDYAGNYTQAAKDTLLLVVDQAKAAVYAGVNSVEVEMHITQLKKAMSDFLRYGYVSIQRNSLQVALVHVDTMLQVLNDKGYQAQVATLTQAYAEAKMVLDTYKVTQAELDVATENIMLVYREVLETVEILDQFAVISAISENLLNNAVVGEYDGQYPQTSITQLQDALAQAREAIQSGTDEEKQRVVEVLEAANELFITTQIKIDFNELDALIRNADAMDEAVYDREDYATLQALVHNMKDINRKTIAQNQVNQYAKDLETNIQNMRMLNRNDLMHAIQDAKQLDKDVYTADSWKALVSALEKAQVIYETTSLTQKELDAALATLISAQKALIQNIFKDDLKELITEAEGLKKDDYTKATWDNLQIALTQVKEVLANSHDQIAIEQAYQQLKQAMNQLVKANQIPDHDTDDSDNKGDHFVDRDQGNMGESMGQSPNKTPNTGDATNTNMLLTVLMVTGGIMYYKKRNRK